MANFFINQLNKIFFPKKEDKTKVVTPIIKPVVATQITAPTIQTPVPMIIKRTMSGLEYGIKEKILQVKNVSLSFGEGKDAKLVLRDINFEINNIVRPNINQGQIISLIGRSGIGKTQLFKILSGLNKPTFGEVFIGTELKPVVAGDAGVVPQNYLMFNHRSVKKNLQIAVSKNKKIDPKERENFINMYADKFSIKEHLDKYPEQLSGGQRQRASITQQLLNGGDFIFFDEPLSGLDLPMVKKTITTLKQVSLEDELRTLIIISHDIANSCSISDTVFVLGLEGDKPGATIKKKIDLMERDIAWKDEKEVKKEPAFLSLMEEIETLL